jgi:hypothetical protein
VAQVYEEFLRFFGLRKVATLLSQFSPRDSWERRLQGSWDDQLRSVAARFVGMELKAGFRDCASFIRSHELETRLARFVALRQEIDDVALTLTPFGVLLGELHALVEASAANGGVGEA